MSKKRHQFAALQPTDVNNVYQLLNGLSSNKATGIDKISCKILKIAASVIADSLTYIFNQAITLSSFSYEWKMARVPCTKMAIEIYLEIIGPFQSYQQ